MYKYLRSLLSAVLVGIAAMASGQIYTIDDNLSDSAQVYIISLSSDGQSEYSGPPAFKLPLGIDVRVERLLKGQTQEGVIIVDDKQYAIGSGKLLFSDQNPEGTEDIFGDTRSRANHSLAGKFFATMVPYLLIALCFIAAAVFMWLGLGSEKFKRIALIVVPAGLLIGSLMEIWAYWVLDTSAFWWCDPGRYGFFGALFRVIPFMAFVAFQLFCIKFYMHLITGDEDNDLSIKPMLISLGICIPAALAATFLLVGVFHIKSPWPEIVFIGTFLISLGIGLGMSFKRNIEELGKKAGIIFSLFGIVWSIGAIVAIIGLLIVVFKLIFQILVCIAAFVGLSMAMANTQGSGSGHTIYYDKNGGAHNSQSMRDAANRRIDNNNSGW